MVMLSQLLLLSSFQLCNVNTCSTNMTVVTGEEKHKTSDFWKHREPLIYPKKKKSVRKATRITSDLIWKKSTVVIF